MVATVRQMGECPLTPKRSPIAKNPSGNYTNVSAPPCGDVVKIGLWVTTAALMLVGGCRTSFVISFCRWDSAGLARASCFELHAGFCPDVWNWTGIFVGYFGYQQQLLTMIGTIRMREKIKTWCCLQANNLMNLWHEWEVQERQSMTREGKRRTLVVENPWEHFLCAGNGICQQNELFTGS